MKTFFPLFLSDTDFTLWSDCELKWFRQRCQWLRKPAFNIDLTAGGAFAKGIELARKAYYDEGKTPTEAVEESYNYVLEHLHQQEFVDELKSPERMALAVIDYFKRFPLDNDEVQPLKLSDGKYSIETKFVLELPINHPELGVPLIYKGKLDMLGEYLGRHYIVDEKTTKSIPRNQADLLSVSGQFVGYAWAAKQLGTPVQGVLVRKVAIQKAGNKIEQVEVPITEYMIDLWEQAMFHKVKLMVSKYSATLKSNVLDGESPANFKSEFLADFKSGCTAFFRPCPFREGCISKFGEEFLKTEFEQITWDYENRLEIPLEEFIKMVTEK